MNVQIPTIRMQLRAVSVRLTEFLIELLVPQEAPKNPRPSGKEDSVRGDRVRAATRSGSIRLCRLASALLPIIMAGTHRAQTPQGLYLSGELSDRIVYETQGWGELGFDVCAHTHDQTPLKLRIGDKEFAHGLGHHANGEIVVDLGGQFQTFQAEVGVEWQGQNAGSVRFRVFVDGRDAFDSGIMHETDSAKPISVSVKGAKVLRLVAEDGGDGITCDAADWAEARLVPDPNPIKMAASSAIDMAPFATVESWNPTSSEGTRGTRVTEFPAQDIRPFTALKLGADGYDVPVVDGIGCVGLQWVENRFLRDLALTFPAGTKPDPDSVSLQFWQGESVWQGQWVDSGTKASNSGDTLAWKIGLQALPGGTQKVRWLFRKPGPSLHVKHFSAITRSLVNDVVVRVEPARGKHAGSSRIEIYNGFLIGSKSPYRCSWGGSDPLVLHIRGVVSRQYKADRTVLRFQMAGRSFGVAIEDLQSNPAVFIPVANLYLSQTPASMSKSAYLQSINGRRSVLDDVRQKPDQSLAHAWEVVHNPIQDQGPMLISLACDNRKFEVARDGSVSFNTYDLPDDPKWVTDYAPGAWLLSTKCGVEQTNPITRHLEAGWYPMPVASVKEGNVQYRQTSYVAPSSNPISGKPDWLRERATCVTEVEIENDGTSAAKAKFTLNISSRDKLGYRTEKVPEGFLVAINDRIIALVDLRGTGQFSLDRTGGDLVLWGSLTPGAYAHCRIRLPAWKIAPDDYKLLLDGKATKESLKHYWNTILAQAMAIQVPDPLLTNLIKASQVHCMIAARCEDMGARVVPWISADRYGPLESESNSIMRGMDMNGQTDFARRSLDYFLAKTNSAGFITTGYTLVGTGECLWTLGEHYNRTKDRGWLKKNAPLIVRICQWVMAQRKKTQVHDAQGAKVPEYGLMPPGVTADWNRFSFRLFNDAQYERGLEMAAKALSDIGDPHAATIMADAKAYRIDILNAYQWVQARAPVVRLANGTWVPGAASMLDCFGPVEQFYPSEDADRTWCYSIEAGAHHLIANGILPANSVEADSIVNDLEDVQFLRSGWGDYPEARNRSDVFDFGGFSKLQPYYTRIAEIHALRDDVKPFIRSYFNTIPAMVSGENLSFWEHLHNRGGWNKTHETGWFLCQTRTMFVTERGQDLWLAPFVTNRWLKDGKQVSVHNAPTDFGLVSYTINSSVARGRIDAVIEFPKGFTGRRIVIRLRHPDAKRIRSVTVQGKPWKLFDAKKDTITLVPGSNRFVIAAHY